MHQDSVEDRRKSERSEGSEKSTTMSDTLSQSKDVVALQKKMKILRDAVLKERQDKEELNKEKADLATEVNRLREELKEKDALCVRLKSENVNFQEKIEVQRRKTENLSQSQASTQGADAGVGSMLGSFFGKKNPTPDSSEYQKLQTEHNYLKKQLETMLERLNKAEVNLNKAKKEHKQENDTWEKKLIEKDRELQERMQDYIKLGQRNDELNNKIEAVNKEKTRLENNLAAVRRELDNTIQERDEIDKSNKERIKIIADMNEVCQKMEKEIESLSEQLSKATLELEETELKLQVFNLKKVGRIVNTPAQILVRRNVNGEYLMEVENAGERIVIYPQSIQTVGPQKDAEDKFYIEYKNENGTVQKDTYISEERKKILRQLTTMIKLANESKDSTGSKKNGVLEKNIFSQVVSFFGN